MKVKLLTASVAAALTLGGATAALAQEYYVIQPAPAPGVVIQERVVTTPAQPVVAVPAVPGERMTVSYTVDDAYPFPSPQSHVTQSGVFVPTQPRTSDGTAATSSRAHRNFNTNGIFNTD